MAEPLKTISPANAASGVGSANSSPAGQPAASGSTGIASPRMAVEQSVRQAGGIPSGRKPSVFRFASGTPEGDEERRIADSNRKKAARAVAQKMVDPPPLPSSDSPQVHRDAAASGVVATDTSGPGFSPAQDNFVPWDSGTLQELTDEIVDGFEDGRCDKLRKLVLEAGLSDKLAERIASNGKYKPAIKRTLKKTLPMATANTLNRVLPGTGKYSAEGILAVAIVANWNHSRRQLAETRRVIQEELAKSKPPPPPPEKKEGLL